MSRVRSRIRDKLSKKQSKYGENRKEDDQDLEKLIETEEDMKARAKVYGLLPNLLFLNYSLNQGD